SNGSREHQSKLWASLCCKPQLHSSPRPLSSISICKKAPSGRSVRCSTMLCLKIQTLRKRFEGISMHPRWFFSSCLLVCASLAFGQDSAAKMPFALDPSKLIDLTYSFDPDTIYWPNGESFQWEKERWGKTPAGTWYASARYAASEHGGTHIDSPIHFAEGKPTLNEIPLSPLVVPSILLD